MIKVGFVGLDTSHPASFVHILNNIPDVQVAAVYDNGAVRDENYIQQFCQEHKITRFNSIEKMAHYVDAAMILGVNWDLHYAQSAPFLKVGKAVYVDKPLCGNLHDLCKFEELIHKTNAPFLAGSGWRFNTKVLLAAQQCAQNEVQELYVESCFPVYFYGIHAAELAMGLLGSGFRHVRTFFWDEDKSTALFSLEHKTGKHVLMKLSPSQQYWRGALYRQNGQWHEVTFGAEDIHGAVCNTFIHDVRSGKSTFPMDTCTASVRIMLAAKQSAETGERVSLDALNATVTFDGVAFEKEYGH